MTFAEFLNALDAFKYTKKESPDFTRAAKELHEYLQSIDNVEVIFSWIKKSETLSDNQILEMEKWAPLDLEDVFSLIYERLPKSQESKLGFIESLHTQYRDRRHLSDKQMLHLMKTYWYVHG